MSGLWASKWPVWPWSRRDRTSAHNEASPLIAKDGSVDSGDSPYNTTDDGSDPQPAVGGGYGSNQGYLHPKGSPPYDPHHYPYAYTSSSSSSMSDCFLKYLLFLSNLLFSVLGLVVLCLGLWGLATKQSFAQERIGGIGTDPMLAFVALGVLLSALCLSGCVGALRENVCLLRGFAATVLVLLTVQVLVAIVAFATRADLEGYLRAAMLAAMRRYQDDLDLRFLTDELQAGLQCCGADSYRDWEVNIYYNCSAPGVMACGVPASCCVAPLENGTVWNSQCGVGAALLDEFSAQSTVFLGGCLGAVSRWAERHAGAIGTAGVVLLGTQVLTLFATTRLLDAVQWHRADHQAALSRAR